MANQPQFDLNKEIAIWKENLWLSGNFNSDELDELESHLRDEVDCASFAPLPDEEKFVLARYKIGSDDTLSKAYSGKRSMSFVKISWIAQAAMCVFIFLLFSRASLFALVDLDQVLMLEDQYVELTIYWLMQISGGIFAFLIFRKVSTLSKDSALVHRANGIIILSTLALTSLFLLYMRFTEMGSVLRGPLVVSAVPIAVFGLLFIAFIIANFRFWRKAKLA